METMRLYRTAIWLGERSQLEWDGWMRPPETRTQAGRRTWEEEKWRMTKSRAILYRWQNGDGTAHSSIDAPVKTDPPLALARTHRHRHTHTHTHFLSHAVLAASTWARRRQGGGNVHGDQDRWATSPAVWQCCSIFGLKPSISSYLTQKYPQWNINSVIIKKNHSEIITHVDQICVKEQRCTSFK